MKHFGHRRRYLFLFDLGFSFPFFLLRYGVEFCKYCWLFFHRLTVSVVKFAASKRLGVFVFVRNECIENVKSTPVHVLFSSGYLFCFIDFYVEWNENVIGTRIWICFNSRACILVSKS